MTAPNELTGQTFNDVEVLRRGPNCRKGNAQWVCRCLCGNEFLTHGYMLKNGKARSCGCRHWAVKHGLSRTRLYIVWAGLHQRCSNPKDAEFHNYGGRGIAVAPEWREAAPFLEWAKANGYGDGLELDRIDNDGPYSPANCRWTTRRKNCNNKRNTIFLEWDGRQWALADLARRYGIDPGVLHSRLFTVKMPLEMALSLPVDRQRVKAIMREYRKTAE